MLRISSDFEPSGIFCWLDCKPSKIFNMFWGKFWFKGFVGLESFENSLKTMLDFSFIPEKFKRSVSFFSFEGFSSDKAKKDSGIKY